MRQKWRPCRAVVEEGALVQLFPCNARKSGLRNFSLSLSLSLSLARASQVYATRASQVHASRQPGVNLSEWYRILKTGEPKPLRGYKVGLSAQL